MHAPIGYLVTTIIVGWCTLFAVAPPRPRRSSPSNASYWFGFILNELPFLTFYWLGASTALAVSEGAPSSWLGRASVALAGVTTLGLALVAWRALRAGPALDRALRNALGPGWRDAIDPELRSRLRRHVPVAQILAAPFRVRRGDVERVANISYGDNGKWNRLDVYRHRARPSGCPTLVHLHGGAFRSGRKNNEARALMYRLASQGWLCLSANYRLGPAARFPNSLIDAKKVLAWIREHGAAYGADPAMVLIAGSSAGARLAATAALTPNDPRFQPGFEEVDTSVAAAICLYGYYGGTGPLPSSPAAYVQADAPPFFIAHGDRDTIVLAEDARAFAATLRAASSAPVVYAELPGAQHTFDLFSSLRFARVVDAVEAFATWILSAGAVAGDVRQAESSRSSV